MLIAKFYFVVFLSIFKAVVTSISLYVSQALYKRFLYFIVEMFYVSRLLSMTNTTFFFVLFSGSSGFLANGEIETLLRENFYIALAKNNIIDSIWRSKRFRNKFSQTASGFCFSAGAFTNIWMWAIHLQ